MRTVLGVLVFAASVGILVAFTLELRRRSLPWETRWPRLAANDYANEGNEEEDARGSPQARSLGELSLGADLLLNRLMGFVLPRKLDYAPVEATVDAAIRAHPAEAEAFGFSKQGLWRGSLREFVHMVNSQHVLAPLGRLGVQGFIQDAGTRAADLIAFAARTKCWSQQETQAKKPEHPFLPTRVVVIVSNYRTGTTALHHALSKDPRAVFFPQWALRGTIAAPNAAAAARTGRLSDAENEHDDLRALAPELAQQLYARHFMRPNDPEEELLYLATTTFALPGIGSRDAMRRRTTPAPPLSLYNASSPLWSLLIEKQLPAFLRAWLHPTSPLWTQFPFPRGEDRFLVLKAPLYSVVGLHKLRALFPHATIVASHRDPAASGASIATVWSLGAAVVAPADFPVRRIARNAMDHAALVADGLVRHAKEINVHVKHADVERDVVGVLERDVYPRLGLAPPPGFREALEQSEAHRRAVLAEYGAPPVQLTAAHVGLDDVEKEVSSREALTRYRETFKAWL